MGEWITEKSCDGIFADFACVEDSPRWQELSGRRTEIYKREEDFRSPFARDYTRVLHANAFRRLKHKTQVFFNISNDHTCTRMEHVFHVESVSSAIANKLGLNSELTKAMSIGHDLGHAPFGHQGEAVLNELTEKWLGRSFWHEQNGLRMVDRIELLEDHNRVFRNLNLTYAVRDGIVSHCGEVDENGLRPRTELFDLDVITAPNEFQAATWEGCVVKISDKIAYLGRDIEDADRLGFISGNDRLRLAKMARAKGVINTTSIIHSMIIDICQNSSPDRGICLSDDYFERLREIKAFNYDTIYNNKRFEAYKEYSGLIITQIFNALYERYDGAGTIKRLNDLKVFCPGLAGSFVEWLARYCDERFVSEFFDREEVKRIEAVENEKIYGCLETKEEYARAAVDFISGMTDRYAVEVFNELITF